MDGSSGNSSNSGAKPEQQQQRTRTVAEEIAEAMNTPLFEKKRPKTDEEEWMDVWYDLEEWVWVDKEEVVKGMEKEEEEKKKREGEQGK
ncbi:hypothetical protein AAE478_003387 [Parahypoxylon ruwenzoriense]